ncbi:Tyrosine recombinase XerD [subsurface metagenome]
MAKIQKRNFKDSIKYLKKEEWDKLRVSIDNYRDKLIITLLYSTGMRVGEFTKLRVEHIDFSERFIRIPPENSKTGEGRTIFVPQEVLNDIRAYLKLEKTKKGRIFDLTTRRIQQLLKKYSSRAGVACTPHTLRHTYITHALLNKVPITAVQKQVGHKRLTTTQIYSDLAPEQVRQAYEKANS